MSQFMLEGMLLSLIAGLVGIAIGTVGAPLLSGILLPQISPFSSRGSSQFQPAQDVQTAEKDSELIGPTRRLH